MTKNPKCYCTAVLNLVEPGGVDSRSIKDKITNTIDYGHNNLFVVVIRYGTCKASWIS